MSDFNSALDDSRLARSLAMDSRRIAAERLEQTKRSIRLVWFFFGIYVGFAIAMLVIKVLVFDGY